MAELAETAAVNLWEEEELACELLIPSQLYPLQLAPFLESIEQTGRLLVVEEGQGFAAWGSELIAQLNEHKERPALNTGRVYAAGQTIPTSRPAEAESLPSIHDVKQSAIDLILA
jgi:2-oxoisovalerate dehydrogenase E1 component